MTNESQPSLIREVSLVIQFITGVHFGSGQSEGRADFGFARDPNGLPGIPGTGFQGALRSATNQRLRVDHRTDRKATVERIFGKPGTSNRQNDRGGRLEVMGWGVLHSHEDQPVPRHLPAAVRDADRVLLDAFHGCGRDHVCLNERGVTDGRGKFDEIVVNPGHRFTLNFRFLTAPEDNDGKANLEADWQLILEVLSDPSFRLGGKTRRGLGAFEIVRGEWRAGATTKQITQSTKSDLTQDLGTYSITPETLWMIGGGLSADSDSAPLSGTRIEWTNGEGRPEPVWIIPGTSIKGALVHRTEFYANLQAGNFIDNPIENHRDIRPTMTNLFGGIKGPHGAQAGQVFIDDVFLPEADATLAKVQMHASINPFIGGAKDSALFDDQPLGKSKPIALRVQVAKHLEAADCEPLKEALNNLATGHLALGAHASRGYGFFTTNETP